TPAYSAQNFFRSFARTAVFVGQPLTYHLTPNPSIMAESKKIGILFGKENSFPPAFVERVNSKDVKGVTAEFVKVEELRQGEPTGYAVILDRISQDVPFYRAYLKNAALTGTAVINNPFWWSADEKFF